jgi:hypothetical protein
VNLVNEIRKILLLVEGSKLEMNLLNKAFQEYNLNLDYVIYPYNTNIYELYERMFEGNEADLGALDLLGILKEKDSGNEILNEEFSDILLIFDYEPQDNRFEAERINLMLDYFNESTDNGKLYINYPMVESFKHLKANPDHEYKELVVDYSIVSCGKYKELVGKETKYHDIKNYDKEHFNSIIIHNIKKANYISKKAYDVIDLKTCYYKLEPEHILREQNNLLHKSQKIYVLNTCLFFICDYNIDLLLEDT